MIEGEAAREDCGNVEDGRGDELMRTDSLSRT
jgi:hypothetical protein